MASACASLSAPAVASMRVSTRASSRAPRAMAPPAQPATVRPRLPSVPQSLQLRQRRWNDAHPPYAQTPTAVEYGGGQHAVVDAGLGASPTHALMAYLSAVSAGGSTASDPTPTSSARMQRAIPHIRAAGAGGAAAPILLRCQLAGGSDHQRRVRANARVSVHRLCVAFQRLLVALLCSVCAAR